MLRVIFCIAIYLGSVGTTVATAQLISALLALYPIAHLHSFGPAMPGVSKAYAAWLPYAPGLLYALAVLSLLGGLYLWRSKRPRDARLLAMALVAAINYFAAHSCAVILLIAYFYLPKLANPVVISY